LHLYDLRFLVLLNSYAALVLSFEVYTDAAELVYTFLRILQPFKRLDQLVTLRIVQNTENFALVVISGSLLS